jgi:phosphotransferase family enzyme
VESAEEWIGAHCTPVGPADAIRERAWATTTQIPTADGPVWFKACAPSHRFEPELVAALARVRPELLPRVLGCDTARGWLLTADAGTSFEQLGNPPELWLRLLPAYAELQREASVPAATPDRTVPRWPELYDDMLESELPLRHAEIERLRRFGPRFAELSEELAAHGLPATVQHDDLHQRNAFVDSEQPRIIDWGDASLSHPFVSVVAPFRFLEEGNGLSPADPWFARLRDAYLEPWGDGLVDAFELAERLGRFVYAFGWVAVRRLLPADGLASYDAGFRATLLRAAAVI